MQPDEIDHLVAALRQAALRFTSSPQVVRDRNVALREIVEGAVATVPGAGYAGITTRTRDGQISSTSPTAEVVARLDQAQAALREGPCVEAIDTAPDPESATVTTAETPPSAQASPAPPMVYAADLGQDQRRWPRFAAEAVRTGVFSMLSFPLSGQRSPATALNIYAEAPRAFDLAARTTAALFADQAAILLYGADHVAALDRALESRDAIGQAKGILMARHGINAGDAFAMLVEASQHANIKLRDVADWLTTDPHRAQNLEEGH